MTLGPAGAIRRAILAVAVSLTTNGVAARARAALLRAKPALLRNFGPKARATAYS